MEPARPKIVERFTTSNNCMACLSEYLDVAKVFSFNLINKKFHEDLVPQIFMTRGYVANIGPFKDSSILDSAQKLMLQNRVGDQMTGKRWKLVYTGTKANFAHNDFVKGVAKGHDSVCVIKTESQKVFGGYTNIPWSFNNNYAKKDGKTFVFKFEQNNFTTYKWTGGLGEVFHSKANIFDMVSPTIKTDKTANAALFTRFEIPEGQDRSTVLCGEANPKLEEVEVFSLVPV